LISGLRNNSDILCKSPFYQELKRLNIHDTACLLYENTEEWQAFVVNYIKIGLERGERCYYVFDVHTARQVRETLKSGGIDVLSAETSGQLILLHGSKLFLKDGIFDPRFALAILREEAQKSVPKGYTSLRLTFEMDWLANELSGSEKVQEFKANLVRDFFPKYPCLGVFQYDRWKFSPEAVKEAILTYSFLIQENHIYSNFFCVPPGKYLNKYIDTDIQFWLDNIKRDDRKERELIETVQRLQMLVEEIPAVILVVDETGHFIEGNKTALGFFECSHEEFLKKRIWDYAASIPLKKLGENDLLPQSSDTKESEFLVNVGTKTLILNVVPTIIGDRKIFYYIGQDKI
jgi:PAS domain-containing protein